MPAMILPADFPRRARSPACAPMVQVHDAQRPGLTTPAGWERMPPATLLAALGTVLMRYGQAQPLVLCIGQSDCAGGAARWRRLVLCADPAQTAGRILDLAERALLQSEPLRDGERLTVGLFIGLLPQAPEPDWFPAGLELLLGLAPAGGRCRLLAWYDADVFLATRMRRLLGHLAVVQQALTRAPATSLCALPLLTAAEQAQLQAFGDGGPASPAASAAWMHAQFEQQAACHPDARAVLSAGTWFTYGAINRAANRLARQLLAAAVGPGQRVVTLLEPSVDVVVTILAILKTGACYVPIDPDYPPDRIDQMLDAVRATALIAPAHRQAARLGAFRGLHLPPADLQAAASALDDRNPATWVCAHQPAVVIFTSGTTGAPKGVELSHANLRHLLGEAGQAYGYDADDCVAALARPTFSITFFETFATLLAGGRLSILPRAVILAPPALIGHLQQATAFHASPGLLRKLTAHVLAVGLGPAPFRHLRHVSSGGDRVGADLIETLKQVFDRAELHVIYGCSEISCMGTTYRVPRDRIVRHSFVGGPFPGMRVRVLDAHGHAMPLGVPGDVHFAGAGLALGYLDQPGLTAERFPILDGVRFYRTGDIGCMHEDGSLELLGRADFQIKLRGIRIEPGEIETHLRQWPGIRECVVNACALPSGETGLTAYVVMAADCALDRRAVRQALGRALPDYMVPAAMIELPALPVNLNNKLDRRALPLPTPQHMHLQQRTARQAPGTATERALAGLWAQLLGMPEPGIDEDFFELGGDSLLTIPLMTEIEARFGRVLPLTTMLTAPTIALLARAIDQPGAPAYAPLLLRAGDAGHTPVFCLHEGNGEVIGYRQLAGLLPDGHAVYGLPPLATPGVPMQHTRIADAVAFYATQILQVQPDGAVALCGMCIGGFLAFEVARVLTRNGHPVEMVAMVDTAHVDLARTQVSAQVRADAVWRASVIGRAGQATQPVFTAAWTRWLRGWALRVRHWVHRQAHRMRTLYRLRIRLLRWHVDHGWRIPGVLQAISVNAILRFAEREYRTPVHPYPGRVLLLLATLDDLATQGGQAAGMPYRDCFDDPLLGWQDKAAELDVHFVPGRHASVLQAGNVGTVAAILGAELARCARTRQPRGVPPPAPFLLRPDPR